jgi:hypothetical protein
MITEFFDLQKNLQGGFGAGTLREMTEPSTFRALLGSLGIQGYNRLKQLGFFVGVYRS